MNATWEDFSIDFAQINPQTLTKDWAWLIGDEFTPIIITSIGDMFLSTRQGEIYWLNVGEGTFDPVANGLVELKDKLNNEQVADEWFMFELAKALESSISRLHQGKLFSFKKLPIIGGTYDISNFQLIDIEVHFSLTGQIHKQLRDLPDGTKVNISFS